MCAENNFTMNKPTTFKRVAIGATFTKKSDEQKYRKVTGTKAVRLLADGRRQTHQKLTVTRSCVVTE